MHGGKLGKKLSCFFFQLVDTQLPDKPFCKFWDSFPKKSYHVSLARSKKRIKASKPIVRMEPRWTQLLLAINMKRFPSLNWMFSPKIFYKTLKHFISGFFLIRRISHTKAHMNLKLFTYTLMTYLDLLKGKKKFFHVYAN